MGRKRKHEDGTQAPKKKYWQDASRARGIPLGTRGVVVSCLQGKEKKSGKEAIQIFSEALEALRPEPAKDSDENAGQGKDISALLAEEVSGLKDRKKHDFTPIMLGIGSIIYIQFNFQGDPMPSQLVMHVIEEADKTKQNKTRLCSRFYPVDYTCPSGLEHIQKLGERVAALSFPKDATETVTFSIDVEKRAAPPGLERIDVINAIANSISQPPYKVNLDNPEKTVLANIIKGSFGVSVVHSYRKFHKLNMLSLTLSGADNNSKESDDKTKSDDADADKNGDEEDNTEEQEGTAK